MRGGRGPFTARIAGHAGRVRSGPWPGAPRFRVAPCAGVVVKLHPHAYVLLAPSADAGPNGGRGVHVHLGIDTVQLGGEGFTLLVDEGDTVTAGQELVAWSPTAVAAGGRSPLVPVVALDLGHGRLDELVRPGAVVRAGDPLFHLA